MKLFPSRAHCKKALRLLFVAALLITLPVLAASWSAFQGRREWNQTKNDLLSRGEKLSLIELAPPSIPDQLNFFADPLWAEIVTQPVIQPDGTVRNLPATPEDQQQLAILRQKPTAEEAAALKEKFPAFATLSFTDPRITIGLRARALLARTNASDAPEQFPAFTLALLRPLSPFLAQIEDLSKRPGARFPLDYQAGFSASLPQISAMLTLAQAFSLRATADIQSRHEAAAFDGCLTLIRLSRAGSNEPFLICHLVHISLVSMVLDAVDKGIKAHIWTNAQLADFERMLTGDDLAAGLALGLRGERGCFNQLMEVLRRGEKQGYEMIAMTTSGQESGLSTRPNWWQKAVWKIITFHYLTVFGASDQAFFNRVLQQSIGHLDAAKSHGFLCSADGLLDPPHTDFLSRYRHLLSTITLPSLTGSFKRTAYMQNNLVQTLLACALERYRLKTGSYPASLEELVPSYLSALPADIITLKPMHYERAEPDQFRLWSAGWDNKDDHGRPASRQLDDGDWPWAEPLSK